MKVQSSILILTAMISSCVHASSSSVVWKERGNTVSASTVHNTSVYTRSLNTMSTDETSKKPLKLKLSTGQSVILTGGVYVSSNNPDTVLIWAKEQGYKAKKDKYMQSVVHLETSPVESIRVAKELSELSDVETAAPNYRSPKILK